MANLLPQSVKKGLRKEYVYRIVIAMLMSSLAACIIAVASLFPTHILLKAKLDSLNHLHNLSTLEKVDDTSFNLIAVLQTRLELLKNDSFSENVPYGIFVRLFEIKSDAIDLSRISYSQSGKKVEITAVAATRKDLADFIDRIETEDLFLPINDFPYSDLSQPKDIDFNLTINLVHNDDE